jgi:hypothetical protein
LAAVDYVEAGSIHATLESADIGTIDLSSMGEFFP